MYRAYHSRGSSLTQILPVFRRDSFRDCLSKVHAITLYRKISMREGSCLWCLRVVSFLSFSLPLLPASYLSSLSIYLCLPSFLLSSFLPSIHLSFLPSLPFLHRRFPVSDIPTGSDEVLADWLIKLYQEKVIYLSTMYMYCWWLTTVDNG